MTYVATQLSDGGLWHAGRDYRNGNATTLCGWRGWVDHRANGEPLPATLDVEPIDELGTEMTQPVECLTCARALRRATVA